MAIVGAGLGGLCAAALAADAGLEPTLFDTAQSPGGVARTVVEDGLRLEPGASTLLVQEPALADVVRWSGAATSELTATDRWVFLAGRGLRRLAPGPGLLLRPPGSRLGELRALITAFRATPPSSDVSLEDYCRSHFGAEYGRLIAGWSQAASTLATLRAISASMSRTSARTRVSARRFVGRRKSVPPTFAGPAVACSAVGGCGRWYGRSSRPHRGPTG
ncbi:MAG: NAD(P)-binding protein [Acidimicrobiia bacterium]|nr:NAD(P)-binding protein [Acidimicrobiia bacterium]